MVFLRRHRDHHLLHAERSEAPHIKAHPRVSLNLDSDGNGRGTVVVAGEARVDEADADPIADEQYQSKYRDYAVSMGMTEEFLAAFSTRLKISIEKVWATPSAE